MSGHPHQGGYDDGYGQHHGNDAYYQDDQQGYHDQYDYGHNQQHGGEGYYDES
jgi:1,3-beta-glucan synthase